MRLIHGIIPVGTALLVACGGSSDSAGPVTTSGVASVIVSAPTTTLQVGQAIQFSAEARDSKGNLVTASSVAWSLSPSGIATINATGLVTALAAGTVTVAATIQGVRGDLVLPVIDAGIPTTVTVSMPGNSFSPFNVTIKAGGTVKFEFPSVSHNVIFNTKAGAPADIQVVANTTVSRVFGTAGTFPYDCTIHPGMSGQVTVVQ